MKYAHRRIIGLIILIFGTIFTLACKNDVPSNRSSQPIANLSPTASPSVSPFQIPENTEVLGVDEKVDKKFHEKIYQRKLKILSVIGKLTDLNKKYVNKFPSNEEHERRKKTIFKLIDTLNEKNDDPVNSSDNTTDLITLAEMCLIMRTHGGYGLSKVTSAYDIAFFYSVKIVALKHKSNQNIMSEFKELYKKHIEGKELTTGDFLLALDGKEPKYLYGKEPTPEEIQSITKQLKNLEK